MVTVALSYCIPLLKRNGRTAHIRLLTRASSLWHTPPIPVHVFFMMAPLKVRPATIQDTSLILHFVRELAAYEKASDQVVATVDHVHRTMFCDNPKVHAVICLDGDTPIGFAVYYLSYSTWQGQHGLYLEDVYVIPEHRRRGAGKAIFKHLAGIAISNDCGRFEWSVLDWNTPSIKFYDSVGAQPQSEWIRYRMTGAALHKLAGPASNV